MSSDIPKLIEQLKKYTFDLEKVINETSALHRTIRLVSRRFFLILRVSYLVAQWLRAATEGMQITVRQPKKEKAVIKRAHDHNRKTTINRTAKG